MCVLNNSLYVYPKQYKVRQFLRRWLGARKSILSVKVLALVGKLCPTLCHPMDCSLPGSSVHGISKARILEWVAISSSRRSSWPRDQTHISFCLLRWQAGSLPLVPPGKPNSSEDLNSIVRTSIVRSSRISYMDLFLGGDPWMCPHS